MAFWVHDVRRRGSIDSQAVFEETFNRQLSDAYFASLSSRKLMQNTLYFTLLYRPLVAGRQFVARSADVSVLRSEQEQCLARLMELAGNIEAVLHDYSPSRLGMYENADGTAFSELIDPVIQRERLTEQSLHAAAGDVEAMQLDEDFLRALEFGAPPMGGLGLGIDRLIMLFTGAGIRETILFPHLKPEA